MIRLPSLTGLRAFEAAARLMSFKQAAAELAVTPTAVSHQIRQLEAELGARLFVRGSRGVGLSETGRALYPDVRDGFEALHRGAERIRGRDRNRLTISTVASFAVKWLVPRLGRFQARYPEIDVRITTEMALVDFARDEIDLAIRYGHGRWPGLTADRLMAEDWRPLCSPDLELASPADLSRHTLLHNSRYEDDWRRWLTMAGFADVEAARQLTFDDSGAVLQAAINGLGVALGRRGYADADLAAGRLVEPFDIHLPQETAFYVVVPERRVGEPAIAAFHDWVLAEAAADETKLAID